MARMKSVVFLQACSRTEAAWRRWRSNFRHLGHVPPKHQRNIPRGLPISWNYEYSVDDHSLLLRLMIGRELLTGSRRSVFREASICQNSASLELFFGRKTAPITSRFARVTEKISIGPIPSGNESPLIRWVFLPKRWWNIGDQISTSERLAVEYQPSTRSHHDRTPIRISSCLVRPKHVNRSTFTWRYRYFHSACSGRGPAY